MLIMSVKNSLRRVKFKLKHDFFTIENIVLVIAIGLCLVWTYQSIAAMSRNWELSERLTEERKNLELISLEVEAAELTNEYYKSNEYQELTARRDLDKKLNGENILLVNMAVCNHQLSLMNMIVHIQTNFPLFINIIRIQEQDSIVVLIHIYGRLTKEILLTLKRKE